jgi:flavin reductase (DIM6/NTAB) family NADH-FMN oxidoreductase RutF
LEKLVDGEVLRNVLRRWVAGVTVVTSKHRDYQHGMTVNSFASLSLNPPLVSITLAQSSRTYGIVVQSGYFGVNILGEKQESISERFAGKGSVIDGGDRFADLETFVMVSGVPFLKAALANLDCHVVHTYNAPNSTLFVGEVLAARFSEVDFPLAYFNRTYHRLMR